MFDFILENWNDRKVITGLLVGLFLGLAGVHFVLMPVSTWGRWIDNVGSQAVNTEDAIDAYKDKNNGGKVIRDLKTRVQQLNATLAETKTELEQAQTEIAQLKVEQSELSKSRAAESSSSSSAPTLIADRYQVLNKGSEIKDTKTGLIWQRCSVGQSWNGRTCEGEAKKFAFAEAQGLAKDGWRVPTVRELFSLIDCPGAPQTPVPSEWAIATAKTIDGQPVENQLRRWCGAPSELGQYINTPAFPNSGLFYWSSSPYVGNSHGAWYVSFDNGHVYNNGRNDSGHVRLVR